MTKTKGTYDVGVCNYCGTPFDQKHDCIDVLNTRITALEAQLKESQMQFLHAGSVATTCQRIARELEAQLTEANADAERLAEVLKLDYPDLFPGQRKALELHAARIAKLK
jgi:hypothetical protein